MTCILKKLWNEYFFDECATLSSDKERELAKKALGLHESLIIHINDEQNAILEEYIDSMNEIEAHLAEKAFLKGCELGISIAKLLH